ncbi:DUF6884 domain-containing protein [Paracoccus litorisediminis]|uniref:DUF6884 domain-containing protein n=1 Tax=Paracoccus litorisediminis TaxID=2006130 RepID=UPI003731E972
MADMQDLHLVACVRRKHREALPAAELYCSPWFLKARRYVEKRGVPWLILSAMHGVIEPHQVIEPYELSLNHLDAMSRREWGRRVIAELMARGHCRNERIVFLAGALYRDPIAEWIGQRAVVPMRGLAIGQQLAWLNQAVKDCR